MADVTEIKLTAVCQLCERSTAYWVWLDDYMEWLHGKYIQDAFPYLDDNAREWLKGTCSQCWDDMMIDKEEQ